MKFYKWFLYTQLTIDYILNILKLKNNSMIQNTNIKICEVISFA